VKGFPIRRKMAVISRDGKHVSRSLQQFIGVLGKR
jgi:hypothetical protein